MLDSRRRGRAGQPQQERGFSADGGTFIAVPSLYRKDTSIDRSRRPWAVAVHHLQSAQPGKIRREENALWSFAPHDLSVILSLVGSRLPESLQCTGEAWLTPGVADTTLTALKFDGGVRAHVFVSWLNPFKEQRLTVVGSRAMVVFDDTLPWAEKLKLYQQHSMAGWSSTFRGPCGR